MTTTAPAPRTAVEAAFAASQTAARLAAELSEALQAGASVLLLAEACRLPRAAILTLTDHPDLTASATPAKDPWRGIAGQRLLTALQRLPEANTPQGVPYNPLLRKFTTLCPKGSRAVARPMMETVLGRVLADPDSGLRLASGPPDTPVRWFTFAAPQPPGSAPPAADPATPSAPPTLPVPAAEPPPQPRRMTMEERLAAHEAEFGTD